MGGPYLESGESIVMTTDRVSIGSVAFDAILTTRRLILIDSRYAHFEPRTILLAAIESIRSGKAATGEPVIILALKKQNGDAQENTIIVFLQEPLENRKQDRDLWVQKFIGLSVSGREVPVNNDVPPAQKSEGIRPSTRRWVAPEIIRPHTEKTRARDAIPNVEIIPDESEPLHLFTEKPEPATSPHRAGEAEPEEGGGYQDIPARTPQTTMPSITGHEPRGSLRRRENGSKAIEVPGPAGYSPAADAPATPGPLPDTPSPLSRSILAAVRSLTVHGGEGRSGDTAQVPLQADIRLTSMLPEMPVSRAGQQPVMESMPHNLPSPADIQELSLHEEIPGIIRNTSHLPEIVTHVPERDESLDSPSQQAPAEKDPAGQDMSGDSPADGSGQSPSLDGIPLNDSVPSTTSVARAPTPVSRGNWLVIAGGVLLCLLLVIAGVMLLPGMLPQDNGPAIIISPPPVPTPHLIPAPTTVAIQRDGVWVRIISPGYFTGQVGNPGSLQSISGSGEKFIKVRDSADLVKVFAEKQDYTGEELLVEIYKNGTIISSRSVTAPMGSVDMLIDPVTEKPPGFAMTSPTGNTTPAGPGHLEYY